jgi:SAM-dependent methyltransferase
MTTYSPTDLEAFVRQRAPEIARDIAEAARRSHNEADLVAAVERVIERFANNFDVGLHHERERTLINGRADAVYNRFVIEYEPPGSLRRNNDYRHNRHAIGQVKQYIDELERLDRHRKERLAGVVLDGAFYIFVRYRDGHWRIDDPLPVNIQSTETFLRYLLSLATELALTPANLVRDFGENSNVARHVMPSLYTALRTTESPKVHILFQQWQRQFREVSGYQPGSSQLDVAGVARAYAVKEKQPDAEPLFFALHTYYATFIKLLAVQIAQYYLMPKLGSGLAAMANLESSGLQSYLAKMERGGTFADFGIRNFLEGDFFGWYLDAWDEALERAMRRLIGDLANYSLVTLDVDPEETRDLLKQLYQNLMPKKLRHALGEYYTPDWLAERLLNQLGYDGDPSKRLLDPACGSGTFLVLAIKRVHQYADDRMLPASDVLDRVLGNIVGFDLNPLAVISARTNYLLALGGLLSHRRGEISIPVYLADSILTPSMETSESGQLSIPGIRTDEKEPQPAYSFNTAVGRFTVPHPLVDARYINQLAVLLEESVGANLTPEQFRARLLHTFPLDAATDSVEIAIAVALYEQLLALDHKGINGIWARIIKNAFAPLFQGRFDYVAGNPPWVNWESLPEEYRKETVPLWSVHNLFTHKGYEAILGKAKDDISVLLTYVALDDYLKLTGRLGFIITQSVFKTAGGGQGFRRFQLRDGTPIAVVVVDDMADLKPFEGASNRTAIVILERGRPTKYPVSYSCWYKPGGGSVIPEDVTLEDVTQEKIATYRQFVAEPFDDADSTSPWITGRLRALRAVKKVLGASDYRAREGVNTGGANGVYWLEIVGHRPDGVAVISNITKGAKRKVENVQAAIEPDLLYPLLRGRDIRRWQAKPQDCILVTHECGMGLKAIPEREIAVRFSKTYAYLKHFEDVLRTRSGYKRYFRETDPFYSIFNIGNYTFSPYKVVWTRVAADIKGAVANVANVLNSQKPIVPIETAVFVTFDTDQEAHYFCAVLNSSPWRFVINSSSVHGTGGFGSPNVLDKARIPQFDPNNQAHLRLSALSQQAHEATAIEGTAQVQAIEAEIDHLAAQLWELTSVELQDIQASLEELQ